MLLELKLLSEYLWHEFWDEVLNKNLHDMWNVNKNMSHLSSCQDMSCQLHLGEISLPNGLEEAVIANVGMLLCGGERVATSRQAVATCRLCRGDRGFNKAVHRWMLQKSQTSRNQRHPHSLTGALILILKVPEPPPGPFFLLQWLHTYKQCSRITAAVEAFVCQSWDICCANRDEPINTVSDPKGGSGVLDTVRIYSYIYRQTHTVPSK